MSVQNRPSVCFGLAVGENPMAESLNTQRLFVRPLEISNKRKIWQSWFHKRNLIFLRHVIDIFFFFFSSPQNLSAAKQNKLMLSGSWQVIWLLQPEFIYWAPSRSVSSLRSERRIHHILFFPVYWMVVWVTDCSAALSPASHKSHC